MIKMMYKNIVSNGLKAIPTHVALKESAQLRKIGFVKISGLIKTGLSSVLEQDAIASVEKSRLVGDGQMTSLEKRTEDNILSIRKALSVYKCTYAIPDFTASFITNPDRQHTCPFRLLVYLL